MPETEMKLDHTYEGQFELIRTANDGTKHFESVQKLDTSVLTAGLDPDLEVNAVKWSVALDGTLTGTAKFLLASSYDVITADLKGVSPEPPTGQEFREARVTVAFTGGTRVCANASGEAKVIAQLFPDGRSRGTLRGVVRLPKKQ